MRKLVRFVVAALAIGFLPSALSAQGVGTVTGQVTDRATQLALPDVQVNVVGTQRGAMTDQQGRFSITGVPAGAIDLRARRVGYAAMTQRLTVAAGATATATFALTTAPTRLEEVVVNAVTGQEQSRIQSGTSQGNINVAEMNKGPITKMADVLQGRVAGVTLQSATGATGGSQRVRIRGANSLSLSNEPLLYMDGVQISNGKGGFALGGQDYSRLNDINPEEIESIEILKGPAASAIYGSAAAVGVILVTTKRGRAGAPVWNVYGEAASFKDKNDYPLNYASLTRFDPSLTAADAYDLPSGGFLRVRSVFGASAPFEICPNYRAAIPTGTTVFGLTPCTQDLTLSFNQFRDSRTTPFETGARGKAGLSVSGGSDALTYFMSADKERENGVLRPNNIEKMSLRTNLGARLGSRANASITAAYILSETERISSDNSVFSPLINALLGPAQYLPAMETDTVDYGPGLRRGSYFGYNTNDQRKVSANQSIDRFIIGSNANYTPLSWLRLNGNAGLDYYGRYDRQTVDPNELPLAQSYILGFRNASRGRNYQWTSNGSATASFDLPRSLTSNTTLGGSFQRALFETLDCFGVGIPSGTRSCTATTSQFAVSEAYTDAKTISAFGRQEFAFADRLFLNASLRADNNSGLIREVTGLAYYPSVNASWVITSEPFFPQTKALSQLRLRAGWGQAGQRPGFGDAETFFATGAVQSGTVNVPALVFTRIGNDSLKVERTTEFEGGFDAGFFSDRISTEFTMFTRRSKDALISRNLAPSAGVAGSVFQNLGSIKNWGTEFGLNANILDVRRVRLDARITGTTLKNRIEALGKDPLGNPIAPITFNRGRQQHRENFPTGAYFALPIKYNDADGNGLLSRNEVTIDSSKFLVLRNAATGRLDTLRLAYIGPTLPTSSLGFSGDLTLFGSVTISTLFERRAGHKQMNETEYFRCRTQNAFPGLSQCSALSNPNASLAEQAAYVGAQFHSATPYGYVEDASFTKWRELSVRIGVPEAYVSRLRTLKGASLTLSGRNLKTWTDYTGLDPEINESGGGSNFTQAEFNTQPPVRTFSARVDVKF